MATNVQAAHPVSQEFFASPVWGDDISLVKNLIRHGESDSASLDHAGSKPGAVTCVPGGASHNNAARLPCHRTENDTGPRFVGAPRTSTRTAKSSARSGGCGS